MISIKDLTIKRKLTILMMATSTVAILLAGAIFMTFTIYAHRQETVSDLTSLADVFGRNCQVALKFDIPEDAEKMLTAIAARPSVVWASVHDPQGRTFAAYSTPDSTYEIVILEPPTYGHQFTADGLNVFHPIYFENEIIGTIHLHDDLRELDTVFRRDINALALLMLIVLTAAYLIAAALQRFISAPILSLAQTAKDVSDKKDYSLRAQKQGHDEIGQLIDSFNDMLGQIQHRDNALKESEEKYRTLVENIDLGVTLVDTERNIIFANSAMGKFFDKSVADLIGHKCFWEYEKRNEICSHCPGTIAMETGKPVTVETEGTRDDGTKFAARNSAFPLYGTDGKPTGFIEVVQDVTVQRQAEHALKQSQQMLQTILDNIPTHVFWKDTDSVYLGSNKHFAQDAGLSSSEEIVGKTDFDLTWSAQAQLYRADDKKVIESGISKINYEEPQTWQDGTQLWLRTSKIPLKDPDGNIVGVLGTYEDITERKKTVEALKESETKFKTIFETSNDGILIGDAETKKFIMSNPRMCEMLGYTQQEFLNLSIMDIHPAEDLPFAMGQFDRLLQEKNIFVEAMPLVHKDGTVFYTDLSASIVELAGQEYAVGSFRDITQRRLLEKQREELFVELTEKNKELEQIVYVSSHDLKSPLVNIQGFNHELAYGCRELSNVLQATAMPDAEKQKINDLINGDIQQSLDYIRTSATKMDTLLDGLLRLSRLGRAALRMLTIDMNIMSQNIIDSLSYQIQQNNVEVTVDTPLPACYGDPAQISQVFTNIIDNAIKYADPDRQSKIHFSGKIDDSKSVYCIKDNGIGINPDHQEKIFEIFHRLDPQGPVTGEGLGLSIVRRILDRHRGSIRVESKPEKGSTFYISIPRKP